MADQRQIVLVTSLGKKYQGKIDIPNDSLRTTDLLNSGSLYWKNQAEKCFENAILLHDVKLSIDRSSISVQFDKIQVKLSEVIYFHDDLPTIFDGQEKIRAAAMVQKSGEQVQVINIITRQVANSFYNLTGSFYGLFKKKSNDKFIPLTKVKLIEIYEKSGKWYQKEIEIPHHFIGIGSAHIEAVRIR